MSTTTHYLIKKTKRNPPPPLVTPARDTPKSPKNTPKQPPIPWQTRSQQSHKSPKTPPKQSQQDPARRTRPLSNGISKVSLDLTRRNTSITSKGKKTTVGDTVEESGTLFVLSLHYSNSPKKNDSATELKEKNHAHHESNIISPDESTTRSK